MASSKVRIYKEFPDKHREFLHNMPLYPKEKCDQFKKYTEKVNEMIESDVHKTLTTLTEKLQRKPKLDDLKDLYLHWETAATLMWSSMSAACKRNDQVTCTRDKSLENIQRYGVIPKDIWECSNGISLLKNRIQTFADNIYFTEKTTR